MILYQKLKSMYFLFRVYPTSFGVKTRYLRFLSRKCKQDIFFCKVLTDLSVGDIFHQNVDKIFHHLSEYYVKKWVSKKVEVHCYCIGPFNFFVIVTFIAVSKFSISNILYTNYINMLRLLVVSSAYISL